MTKSPSEEREYIRTDLVPTTQAPSTHGPDARHASPVRNEDILDVAMEHFWGAEGGNKEGVKAVLAFARRVYFDQAAEAAAEVAYSFDHGGSRYEPDHDAASMLRAIRDVFLNEPLGGLRE